MAFFSKIKAKLTGKKTDSYDSGLKKSRNLFTSRINSLSAKHLLIDESYFEELEEILVNYDVGYQAAESIVLEIKKESKAQKLTLPSQVNEIIIDKMFVIYTQGKLVSTRLHFNATNPTVILVAGVNGNGKTTTVAKLAHLLKQDMQKKVLVIAADTFRAAAVEQLSIWAQRAEVDIYKGAANQNDPASIVFQGLAYSLEHKHDVVLIDTAGRLENKVNLMNELGKINKVINQRLGHYPDEVLLVIDGTTGQNGVTQAIEFAKVIDISGIVLTKMDGTAKGGIILAIKESLDVPVKLIGFGEKLTDLEEFDLDKYVYGLTHSLFDQSENVHG